VTPEVLAAGAAGAAAVGFSLRFNWWRPKRPGTPVLMYHQVGPHRPGSPLNTWRVSERVFAAELDVLARRGIHGIALRTLLEKPADPLRRAVLTFDDGYDGIRTRALPLLLAKGFRATVFAVSGRTGGVNDWDGESPGEPLLSDAGLRELHAAGFEIGSHGATHRALTKLSDRDLHIEVAGSKERLENILGAPVISFCYPFGDFDDRVVNAVKKAGYRAATVIRGGISPDASDAFRIRRVAVRGTDTLLDFRLALTRGRSKL
jgi:peptidoglycan/xylan/chitin deacetylase (PgdA/CDA1 family)